MIDYIEVTKAGTDDRVLLRVDRISMVQKLPTGGCIINTDLHVREGYDLIVAHFEKDPHRFVCGYDMDFRVRWLKSLTVWTVARRLRGARAVEFLRNLLACGSEADVQELVTNRLSDEDFEGAVDTVHSYLTAADLIPTDMRGSLLLLAEKIRRLA